MLIRVGSDPYLSIGLLQKSLESRKLGRVTQCGKTTLCTCGYVVGIGDKLVHLRVLLVQFEVGLYLPVSFLLFWVNRASVVFVC